MLDDEKGKGLPLKLSGSGSLDEEGKRKIDFLFHGPNLQDKSTFDGREIPD